MQTKTAATAEARRWRPRERELREELSMVDRECELLKMLAGLRASVAGHVACATDLGEFRAAITAVFEHFTLLWPDGSDPVLVPRVRSDAIERHTAELEVDAGELHAEAVPSRVP
jgi:hypothetical protein